ncbi:MAG: PAS domain S-box protein [Proteobacteria bacterium]|nr:PAS domain S-box protein [Pseudomonadota bacterium]
MLALPPDLALRALDSAPDALIIIDGSGLIAAANRQVTALFGYSHDEVIAKPVEHLIPERFRAEHRTDRQGYMRDPHSRPMGAGLELFGIRKDGTEFPVEISLSPIEDESGTLVAAAIRDVTERKRIETELAVQLEDMRRFHELSSRLIEAADLPNVLEEVLDAVIGVQDADFGNIQLRNTESGTLSIVAQRGFSPAFLEYFHSVDASHETACGRALRAGARVIIDDIEQDDAYLPYRGIAAQEGYRAVQSAPIRGHDGITTGMLSTYFRAPHRPSARKLQLTDVYTRLLAELIRRIGDEDTVRRARDEANRANQAKSRFLATASHDLRQPLQTISLLNGTLRRRSLDDCTRIEALAHQDEAIGAMSRLLNALLDISKLESGAVKPDPSDFAVTALFEELRHEFAGLADEKGLSFRVTPSEDSIHSDPSLVGQVLRNLVSNAIKYTQAGWVALRCLHDGPAVVRIEVLDTGIGIPDEKLRYIYDEFYQIGVPPNATRDGYGLGLSIVQRIVNLLDAKLDVQSEVGKGSLFALSLPAAPAAARPACAEADARSQLRPVHARILLVEDDPAVLNATRMLLRIEGYQVSTALSMAEALEQAAIDSRIDLLVTDYHLQAEETGTQVIAALRTALGRPLKAILMTGDTSSDVGKLRADPLLRIASKPVHAEELLTLLQALLASN